jgi:hypothetical protein
MFSKLKQIKDLRGQAKEMQNQLAKESVDVTAARGRIKLTMNGNQEVLNVEIDPELLTSDNKTKLEAGMKEAFNDAVKKIQKVMAQKMQQMGGLSGLGL